MEFAIFWILAGVVYVVWKLCSETRVTFRSNQYMSQYNFNRDRQFELEHKIHLGGEDRMEVCRLCGRTINVKNDWDKCLAVRQISLREGWQYHDIAELSSDPGFIKACGGKWDPNQVPGLYPQCGVYGKDAALRMNAETDRREEWKERYPRGKEVDVFPMDFKTEEEYHDGVEKAFYSWRPKHYEIRDVYRYGLSPYSFEREADYVEALRKKKEHLAQYPSYKPGDFPYRINEVEEAWDSADPQATDEERAVIAHQKLLRYRSLYDYCLPVLREKAAMHGVDFDAVIERYNAENKK